MISLGRKVKDRERGEARALGTVPLRRSILLATARPLPKCCPLPGEAWVSAARLCPLPPDPAGSRALPSLLACTVPARALSQPSCVFSACLPSTCGLMTVLDCLR